MPSVNGQVLSAAALHASMSISSFAPAARMFGWLASTASAGSFCLFSENGVVGLPLVTRTPPATPALAGIDAAMATASTAGTTASLIALIHIPLFFQPDGTPNDCGERVPGLSIQPQHRLQSAVEARLRDQLADGEQDPGRVGLAARGPVADREGLAGQAEDHLLVGDHAGKPDRVDGHAALLPTSG